MEQTNAIIGAHNCLTAYRPTKWWMRLTAPLWRCQSLTVEELAERGVTLFDLRVARDRNGLWRGAHGIAMTVAHPLPVLGEIADRVQGAVVRLILERGDEEDRGLFARLCASLEATMPEVKFIGGNYKPTWERLYSFKGDDVHDDIEQMVGSMDPGRKLWAAAWPWLYARIYNRRHLESVQPGKYYLFDFLK